MSFKSLLVGFCLCGFLLGCSGIDTQSPNPTINDQISAELREAPRSAATGQFVVDMRNYMIQPLNGQMLCQSNQQLCMTSYLNKPYGEFYYIYTNGIHDYLAISGSSSKIGVIRSYDTTGDGLRCFSNPNASCSSPPNSSTIPEGVPYMFGVNKVGNQAELAAENSDGSPRTTISGSLSPSNGTYLTFGVNTMNPTTCAQHYSYSVRAVVYVTHVIAVPFGGNVGTHDAVVVDEFEKGPTQSQDHVERYFYVSGLGRVRGGSATYDTNTGYYDLSTNNSVRNVIESNTISISADQCPQGSTTPL